MPALLLAATATALATAVGAWPVYRFGDRAEALRPALWGVVIGVMTVASVQGLLLPAFSHGAAGDVLAGVAAGVLFLAAARRWVRRRDLHLGTTSGARAGRGILVFVVLLVHSLPEGLALGAAWASGTSGLGVFVFLAIAVQNVPEGTAAAIPLRDAGVGRVRGVMLATVTGIPQPVGAVLAYLAVSATRSLLGASFGFAAGAMLGLLAVELVPAAWTSPRRDAALRAALVSAAAMVILGLVLRVG